MIPILGTKEQRERYCVLPKTALRRSRIRSPVPVYLRGRGDDNSIDIQLYHSRTDRIRRKIDKLAIADVNLIFHFFVQSPD